MFNLARHTGVTDRIRFIAFGFRAQVHSLSEVLL